jgi:hypothetical protein
MALYFDLIVGVLALILASFVWVRRRRLRSGVAGGISAALVALSLSMFFSAFGVLATPPMRYIWPALAALALVFVVALLAALVTVVRANRNN